MKRQSWLILLIVTVVVAAAAFWTVSDRAARLAEQTYGDPLFPNLQGDRVNTIAELRFDTGHATWSLKRGGDGTWVMPERGGYPADPDRVKQAVVAIASAKIVAPKTADPAQHHRLDLNPPEARLKSEDDVKTVAVTVLDGSGKVLAEMLRGRTKALPTNRDPGQAYVRRAGEDRTWLVESRLDIRKDPTAWLDKTLIKVRKEEFRAVTVAHPDGAVLSLKRNRFGTLNIEGLDESMAEDDIRLTAVQRALEFLPFADVKPASEVDMTGATEMTIEVDDGTTVVIRSVPAGFEVDDDPGHWVTFEIAHDPTSVTAEEDLPVPGPNDEGKKREVDVEAGAERAAAGAERTRGWAYLFAEFTAQNFRRTLDEVSDKKEGS